MNHWMIWVVRISIGLLIITAYKSPQLILSLFIYQLTGYRSFDNHPITARLSKIPLY